MSSIPQLKEDIGREQMAHHETKKKLAVLAAENAELKRQIAQARTASRSLQEVTSERDRLTQQLKAVRDKASEVARENEAKIDELQRQLEGSLNSLIKSIGKMEAARNALHE